jgi:uncharacterized repeat protein (TIGR03837 family)
MTENPFLSPPDYEIFCQVVDNYGDIGVCWRLARSLVHDHGCRVRLWVDDLGAFSRLCPALQSASEQTVIEGVDIQRWTQPFAQLEPAAVVIEAFACDLPAAHIEAMAARDVAPVWINLEYLSAENWVSGCHGLASPHPALALTKHFFFPGFDTASGGLLREEGLIAARDGFRVNGGREAWLRANEIALPGGNALVVSLFAYEQAGMADLVELWAQSSRPMLLLVPEGRVLGDLAQAFGVRELRAGMRLRKGTLLLAVLPFTDQDAYDRLLWACDLNFVRGEDSFVRAQWAGKPFVWHIYAQENEAHFDKLDAFLQRYCVGLDAASAHALVTFNHAWNGRGEPAAAWSAFAEALPAIDAHARSWEAEQSAEPDLALRLMHFCNHIVDARG